MKYPTYYIMGRLFTPRLARLSVGLPPFPPPQLHVINIIFDWLVYVKVVYRVNRSLPSVHRRLHTEQYAMLAHLSLS